MLDNYELTQDGTIKQIESKPFEYNLAYSSNYSNLAGRQAMANLRLGYIVGSIGHIPKSIMDVGYGNGDFLNACRGFIENLYGNDIEPAYPLESDISFVKEVTSQYAEVITFFDCLEHFPDIEFVKDLKCKYVIVSLPWCTNGLDDAWFANWKHRKPDEHLYHFTEKSLQAFMDRQGYDQINHCNIEDAIRKDKALNPNILTGCFKKRNYEDNL